MEFHKSAEELQTLRRKLTQAQMPCRSGPKDSVADGSEEQSERLKDQLEELQDVLSEERILRKGNISVGSWNNRRKLVEISVAKGVHWNVFGKSLQGHLVLEAEEALYMLDHGMLELYYNDLPVSVQEAYELLLSDEFPLYHYSVYCYLRNLGFIVLRYKRRNDNVSKQTSLNAEEECLQVSVEVNHEAATEKVTTVGEETLQKLQESKTESEVKKTEEQQIEDERKIVVDENNPVSYYWKDEECRPLVYPSDATSLENILNKLQVIKGQTRQEASQNTSAPSKFQITYDVFQPQKNFRKTNPGLPDHSICICKFSESPPTIGEMNFMASQSYPVPLKYAVVDGKDVSFYSILDVQLPTNLER